MLNPNLQLDYKGTSCTSYADMSSSGDAVTDCISSEVMFSLDDRLKAMDEERKRMERELDEEMNLKRKEMEMRKTIIAKRILMEKKNMREEEEHDENLLQEEILRQRKEQLNRMMMRQRLFDDEAESLDKEMRKLKANGKKKKRLKVATVAVDR